MTRPTATERPRIMITPAERRRAIIAGQLARVQTLLRNSLPQPKEDPAIDHLKAVLMGTAKRPANGARPTSSEALRANLWSDAEADPKPPARPDVPPLGETMPLALSAHILHLVLVLTALPIGIAMSVAAVVCGHDFRRTAQVMTLTGLMYSALHDLPMFPAL